jgi:N-acetylmuramoyl-L-alanine amidase
MKTIMLSAGHGGSDPGAVGNGVRESDANIAIALACRDFLNKYYSGHRVILPRERDIFVSLPARRSMAAEVKPEIFISIHNNAASNPAGRGFETFTHSGPLFARTIEYQRVMHETVWNDALKGLTLDRGCKRHNHWITREIPAPTILMEYLFVTNKSDAALLKRPEMLEALGHATGLGVARCLNLSLNVQPKPDPPVCYRVIAGSYRERGNAEMVVGTLKAQGINAFIEIKN